MIGDKYRTGDISAAKGVVSAGGGNTREGRFGEWPGQAICCGAELL